MALIIDPDLLNQGTEIDINPATREITLNLAGNLSEDGVTLQALFSFLKEEWKNDSALIPHPFPLIAITSEQFEFVDGWKPFDDATRKLIRTGGWRELDENDFLTREYLGVITLGNIDSTSKTVGDKAYYFFDGDAARTEFTYAGPVNEPIQTFGDADNGNFDSRSSLLTVVIRQQGKTYDSVTTFDIGVTTITNKVERFPLTENADLKIDTDDIDIDANSDGIADIAPYDGMSITYIDHQNQGTWANATLYAPNDVVQSSSDGRWYITTAGGTSSGDDTDLAGGSDSGVIWTSYNGERQIGSTWYAFGVIVDGNSAVAEDIYEFVQWSLRQNVDIDDGIGTQNGYLAEELLRFIGDTLRTTQQSNGQGVFIDNFDSNDTNRLAFEDDNFVNTARTFPFVAAGTINFNPNLQSDPGSPQYRMFFEYTTRTAVSDLTITGSAGSSASIESPGGNLPALLTNDYFTIRNSANPENNGVWQVTDASPTINQFDATKWNGDAVVDEAAFAGIIDENPISSPDAIIVNDNGGSPISGTIAGASVSFDFDYDGNVQGGRVAGTDAAIVLKAIGLETAAYVEATGTITRATGLNFTLVAPLERVYVNP